MEVWVVQLKKYSEHDVLGVYSDLEVMVSYHPEFSEVPKENLGEGLFTFDEYELLVYREIVIDKSANEINKEIIDVLKQEFPSVSFKEYPRHKILGATNTLNIEVDFSKNVYDNFTGTIEIDVFSGYTILSESYTDLYQLHLFCEKARGIIETDLKELLEIVESD